MSKDDARTRLLNAAGPIFAEKGYRAATVREICETAEVNLASVNYYFGDKETLYVETLQRSHPPAVIKHLPKTWPEGTPSAEKLKDYISAMMTELLCAETAPWRMPLMMRELQSPTPAGSALLRKFFGENFSILLSILAEVLPEDTPSYRRQQIGLSIIGQCVHYRVAGKIIPLMVSKEEFSEHFKPEQLAEHIAQVMLAALGLGPPLADGDRPSAEVGAAVEETHP